MKLHAIAVGPVFKRLLNGQMQSSGEPAASPPQQVKRAALPAVAQHLRPFQAIACGVQAASAT
jgi:hypothetical protein